MRKMRNAFCREDKTGVGDIGEGRKLWSVARTPARGFTTHFSYEGLTPRRSRGALGKKNGCYGEAHAVVVGVISPPPRVDGLTRIHSEKRCLSTRKLIWVARMSRVIRRQRRTHSAVPVPVAVEDC